MFSVLGSPTFVKASWTKKSTSDLVNNLNENLRMEKETRDTWVERYEKE